MLAKTIPRSSLGTNPVDIVLDVQIIPIEQAIKNTTVIHLCLYKNPNEFTYLFVVAVNAMLNLAKNRPNHPLRLISSSCVLRNTAQSAGLSVNAFTADIIIATIKVIPNCS